MRYLLVVLALCCGIRAAAQDTVHYRYGYIPQLKVQLLALNGLVDARPFLESGLEYRTGKRTSVEGTFGVLMPYAPYEVETSDRSRPGEDPQSFHNRSTGIRLRLSAKRFDKLYHRSNYANNYIAAEFLFNYNTLKSTGWYERFEDVYLQYMTYTRHQVSTGLGFKAGEQIFFAHKNIYMDYYFGAGVRMVINTAKDVPEDIRLGNGEGILVNPRGPGTYIEPYVIAALKIGLVLKKDPADKAAVSRRR